MFRAAEKGDTKVVEFLLTHGAPVGMQNSKRETALHLAAANRKTEVVNILLRYNAQVDALGAIYYAATLRADRSFTTPL